MLKAVQQVNDAGSIPGYAIIPISAYIGARGAGAAISAYASLANTGVIAIVGAQQTADVLAIVPLAEDVHVPLVVGGVWEVPASFTQPQMSVLS